MSFLPSNRSLFKPQAQQALGRAQLFFETKIRIATAIRFEIRFRQSSVESWTIAREDSSPDSIILLKPKSHHLNENSQDIEDYMEDLNPDLRTRPLDSGSNSGTISWIVEVPVAPARRETPHMEQVMFGKPFGGNFLR